MTNYTTNIAQNPGLQLGLSGYAGINNTTLVLSPIGSGGTLFGNPGLLVTTPGAISGEGLLTPQSQVLLATNHSASVYIQGTANTGNVTVSVISNPGGTILGSVQVTLTNAYQRAIINNIPADPSMTLNLLVTTDAPQAIQFWITNVQIEQETPAQDYCDGGQDGCSWLSSVGGVSFQPFQNTIVSISPEVESSGLVFVLVQGEAFNISASSTENESTNIVGQSFSLGPVGAMTDFSIAALTDPDPAQTYVGFNNAGITVPTSGYARSQGTFYPPRDYFVSGGQRLYKRAAFMAVGFQFSSVANNAQVNIADIQVENPPMGLGSPPSASAYVLPRAIQTIIKPNRLNYCFNPNFEVSTAGWSPVNGGVLSQDGGISAGVDIELDDQIFTSGSASMNVAVTNAGDGAKMVLTDLIAGDTYIVSAYVQADVGISDIIMVCANGATSVLHGSSGTGYGTAGYGGGYYGGNPPTAGNSFYGAGLYGSGLYGTGPGASVPTGQFFRIFTVFQPTDETATLQITANIQTSPTDFWVDAVLVEPGEVLGFYFDGNFGDNYFWETGGTPGLTRSYYYDQSEVKSNSVTNVLSRHTPMGISYTPPQYFVPPTQ